MSARKGNRDPIFAAIERHAKAAKAAARAEAALASLKARIDARASEKRKHESRRLTCTVPFFDLGGTKWNPAAVIKSRDEIKLHVFRVFDTAAHGLGRRVRNRVRAHEREALAELLRQYDAFQRAHRAHRKAVGLAARTEAAWTAERAAMDALGALTKTKPQTPEGRQALAAYMAGLSPSRAPWWAMRQAWETLAA